MDKGRLSLCYRQIPGNRQGSPNLELTIKNYQQRRQRRTATLMEERG